MVTLQSTQSSAPPNTPPVRLPRALELNRKIYTFIAAKRNETDEIYQHRLSRMLLDVEHTESGNATRFYARYGHLFRWIPAWKCFLFYNGKFWEKDERKMAYAYAKRVAAYIETEAELIEPPTDDEGQPLMLPTIAITDKPTQEQAAILAQFKAHDGQVEALKKWAKTSRSRRSLDAMIELVKSERNMCITADDLDTQDHLLNCQNGTLDLTDGKLLPHNPAHLITKITNCNYNPGASCPRFESFIQKAMCGNTGNMRYLQQQSGMGLSGNKLDDFFNINYGQGGNGKTVYVNAMRAMLNSYAQVADANLFLEKDSEGISNDKARLVGTRFLISSETDEGKRLAEALVKSLTGGDPITARFLWGEYFEFIPKFTPMLLTNPKPTIYGTDNGIWRRVKFIPWDHNFEADPDRKDKAVVLAELAEEQEGILNWCYAGYRDRVANGPYVSTSIQAETDKYRHESDLVGEFIKEKFVKTGNEQDYVDKKIFFKEYQEHMKDTGHKALASNRLGSKMLELKYRDGRVRVKKADGTGYERPHVWYGIRLKTDEDINAECKADEAVEKRQDEDRYIQETLEALTTIERIDSNAPVLAQSYTDGSEKQLTAKEVHTAMTQALATGQESDREWCLGVVNSSLSIWQSYIMKCTEPALKE